MDTVNDIEMHLTEIDIVNEENKELVFEEEYLRVRFGFDQCFSVDRVGRSGGIAVLWKRHVQCQITGYSQNHIDVVFSENNTMAWRLSCFYGYPERSRRRSSWDLIRKLESLSSLPWCIWGDFNDMLYEADKKDNTPHPRSLLEGFRNTMEAYQLTEVDLSGGKFTWERSRGSNVWVRERLDKAFATAGWWAKFPLCNLTVLHTSSSDHEPILLELLHPDISKKKFRFRFENTWLKEATFIKEASEVWANLPPIHLLPKLLAVSSFMARWGRTFFHKFCKKLKVHKTNLACLVDSTDDASVTEYLLEREKLNTLLLHEEMYWRQRDKLFWLTEGDENTKFFNISASARKKANHITYLVSENGVRVDEHDGMCDIVKDYFTELFVGEVESDGTEQIGGHRSVIREKNLELTKELSYEEFTVVIKQMHPDKASGPDGLNPAFFQSF